VTDVGRCGLRRRSAALRAEPLAASQAKPAAAIARARIIQLYRAGVYCFDIARAVGVSKSTVHKVVKGAKASGELEDVYRVSVKWVPEMDEELRRLCEAGIGWRMAIERIGVCPQVLRRRRDELGLPKGIRGPAGQQAHQRWWKAVWQEGLRA
jgi:hypothetical protein